MNDIEKFLVCVTIVEGSGVLSSTVVQVMGSKKSETSCIQFLKLKTL